ncbi:conjugal transfer protein TraF [Vibrio mediterranei]|uniref:Uncharacterized protein n=1 Tax=Vibrio mediterranei TaxID=689 RepID=A0ABX5D642_9VIBR|nr:conjugal transfer protein TraF [Vibrio mediterranei]MCG9658862.1 conjugal transfer protein TraF [Vibrio mediterranei]PRQ65112.1 hypothetical protein COR51_23615 [Vibrio mediterranei]
MRTRWPLCLLAPFLCLFTSAVSLANDQTFSERYGIFFVFESTCSGCMKIAPTLSSFTEQHGIYVKAISKDGKSLRTWTKPWSADKNGTLYRLKVEEAPTPALILRDTYTGQNLPIGIGVMTREQLSERLYQLTNYHLEAN